jgi:hypothetical protein
VIMRLKHILLEPLFLFRLEYHVLWAWIFIQNRQAQRDDTPVHSYGLDNGRVGITVGRPARQHPDIDKTACRNLVNQRRKVVFVLDRQVFIINKA